MDKKNILPVVVVLAVIGAIAMTADATPPTSIEIQIATGVEDREPIGTAASFSNTVERIYCFTLVGGAMTETTINHIWYYGDMEMARVTLPVKSETWRTWSSKRILPEWIGTWRVDVTSDAGEVLMSQEFEVTAP